MRMKWFWGDWEYIVLTYVFGRSMAKCPTHFSSELNKWHYDSTISTFAHKMGFDKEQILDIGDTFVQSMCFGFHLTSLNLLKVMICIHLNWLCSSTVRVLISTIESPCSTPPSPGTKSHEYIALGAWAYSHRAEHINITNTLCVEEYVIQTRLAHGKSSEIVVRAETCKARTERFLPFLFRPSKRDFA